MTKIVKSTWTVAIFFSLIMMLALPVISFGQGRGNSGNRFRKCGKFVNCHDARDGRWDNRGPRGSRVGHRTWDNDRGWRTRRVDRDGDGDFDRRDVRLGRRNRVDRDGDGDFDRRDVRLGQRQIRRNGRSYR